MKHNKEARVHSSSSPPWQAVLRGTGSIVDSSSAWWSSSPRESASSRVTGYGSLTSVTPQSAITTSLYGRSPSSVSVCSIRLMMLCGVDRGSMNSQHAFRKRKPTKKITINKKMERMNFSYSLLKIQRDKITFC